MRGNKAKQLAARAVQEARVRYPGDEAAQIDEIAEIRNWFGPEENSPIYALIREYLSGTTHSTAIIDKLRFTVLVAEEADTYPAMDFWCSVFHHAKRIPYKDAARHERLLSLIQNLKLRPYHKQGPDDPDHKLQHAFRDFGLWVSEVLNDCPGCGSGYSLPEIHGWANLNYFWGLMAREDHWNLCHLGVIAMVEGLEEAHITNRMEHVHNAGTGEEQQAAYVLVAAVWIFVLGKWLYKNLDLTPSTTNGGYPVPCEDGTLTKERWSSWKRRFGEVAESGHVGEETRVVAIEAVAVMEEIEKS